MREPRYLLTALLALALIAFGCTPESSGDGDGDGDDGAGGEPAMGAGGAPDGMGGAPMMEVDLTGLSAEEICEREIDTSNLNELPGGPNNPNESCLYDPAQKGVSVGKQIENFPMRQWNEEPFWFHKNCGTTKAIWVFLSTGWCGACENYAPTVQGFYELYKDQGLEVVWVVGEDPERMPPTCPYMVSYKRAKNVDFTIIRDNSFDFTERYVDPTASNSLPKQYILDGQTMEMVFAGGGRSQESEDLIRMMVGAEDDIGEPAPSNR